MFSPASQTGFDFNENVKLGTAQNFNELIEGGGKSLVMFFAPWCGHCKSAKPYFNDAATKLDKEKGQLIAVDCTIYKGKFQQNC